MTHASKLALWQRRAGTILVLCLLALGLSVQTGLAQTPGTDGIDEIVVVGSDTFIYVYDYTGELVYTSPEGGWLLVETADLNGDGDYEIIAANSNVVKVFDPQVIGSEYNFNVTYTNVAGDFTKIARGNINPDDDLDEIALIYSRGGDRSRIIVYDPPNTTPFVDYEFCCTDWRDFAIGDYDGDGDDDYALIDWNPDNPANLRNLFEIRKGHDPDEFVQGSDNAGELSDSEWFDVAAGQFDDDDEGRMEWVGTQNLDKVVVAQRWRDRQIRDIWSRTSGGGYNFLAVADFRDENDVDQVAMLRNIDDSGRTSLQFVKNGTVWSSITGLGTGWLDFETGNLDNEANGTQYREVALLRADLIRVYLITQSTNSFLNCATAGNCLEISGSFRGAMALGDLGTVFPEDLAPEPFRVEPLQISRVHPESLTNIPPVQLKVYGEQASGVPLSWKAVLLPDLSAREAQALLRDNPALAAEITRSESSGELGQTDTSTFPPLDWFTLDKFAATTSPTSTIVTGFFTNRGPGMYRGTILYYPASLPQEDRFRYTDVSMLIYTDQSYLPLVLR